MGEWSGRGRQRRPRGGGPGETRDTWRTWIGMGRWWRVRASLESTPTNRSGWERERERVEQLHDPFTAVGSKSKTPYPHPPSVTGGSSWRVLHACIFCTCRSLADAAKVSDHLLYRS
ncbi:hypothetical protein NL676_010424 [Syzygium grande]|nr:hypothetical protein NL676_010424 [Syzygium grande]